jgi:hypothetical protein
VFIDIAPRYSWWFRLDIYLPMLVQPTTFPLSLNIILVVNSMNFSKALICAAVISSAEASCTSAQKTELIGVYGANKTPTDTSVTTADAFWTYLNNKLTATQKTYPCQTCYSTYAKAMYTNSKSSACAAGKKSCATTSATLSTTFSSCTTADPAKDSSVVTGSFAVSAALAAAIVMLN